MRDKLRLPYTDVGDGWLIFDVPEADVGFHPIKESGETQSGTHEVSFYCDDIRGTVASLKERGVKFEQDIIDASFGFVTYFMIPGGVRVELYEPKYVKQKTRIPTKTLSRRSAKTRRGRSSRLGRGSRSK